MLTLSTRAAFDGPGRTFRCMLSTASSALALLLKETKANPRWEFSAELVSC